MQESTQEKDCIEISRQSRNKNLNNISSIFHKRFEKLHELTQNYNKAVFLDKCLFWFQISKYTLDDDKIWFTRSISDMAKELNLSERSINRFLKEFSEKGYIKTTIKLFMKKRLYIQITDKLLQLIECTTPTVTDNAPIKNQPTNTDKSPGSIFLEQDGVINNDNKSQSIYKDKDINKHIVNNTVSQPQAVNNSKQTPVSPLYPTYPIEEFIGEQLSSRESNYIKGMMHNLQRQHGLKFSSPEQLFAEIVFSALNEAQLVGITGFNHRIQIIAKLLRDNRWKTPKGFYNHSAFGALFQKPDSVEDGAIKAPNTDDLTSTDTPIPLERRIKDLNNQLTALDNDILGEQQVLDNHQKYVGTDALVDIITNKINQLASDRALIATTLDELNLQAIQNNKTKYPLNAVKPLDSWKHYDILCAQQKVCESKLEHSQIQFEKALAQQPPNPMLVQACSEIHRQHEQALEQLNEELYLLGEALCSKQVA